MALAVQSAAMASNGETAVHPFFTTPHHRSRSKSIPSDITQPDDGNFSTPTNEELLAKDVHASESMAKHTNKPRRGRGPNKLKKSIAQSQPQQLQLVPSTTNDPPGRPILQKPSIDVSLRQESIDLNREEDEDSGGGRKKRRRITPELEPQYLVRADDNTSLGALPPIHLNSTTSQANDSALKALKEQPIHESYGLNFPPKTSESATIPNSSPIPELADTVDGTGHALVSESIHVTPSKDKGSRIVTPTKSTPGSMDSEGTESVKTTPKRRTPRKATSEKEAKPNVVHETGQVESISNKMSAVPIHQAAKTPPKKMLKLRNDGKLKSPKAITDNTKNTKKKKRGTGQGEDIHHQPLRILYGTDENSRQAFGKRIESILLGEVSVPIVRHQKLAGRHAQAPAGPPKAPHPFFAKPSDRKMTDLSGKADRELDKSLSASGKTTSAGITKNSSFAGGKSWAGFGSTFSKLIKHPGAIEPLWPPREMLHARGLQNYQPSAESAPQRLPQRKLKATEARISQEEEILRPYSNLVKIQRSNGTPTKSRLFLQPTRKLMTGSELQKVVKERAYSRLPSPYGNMISNSTFNSQTQSPNTNLGGVHSVILKLYSRIKDSLSPFDMFECENQDWIHKYAPKRACDVLQVRNDAQLFRDWLFKLTVTAVDSGKSTTDPNLAVDAMKRLKARARRKRKRLNELDDFLVDDEEDTYTDNLTEPEDFVQHEPGIRLPRLTAESLGNTKAVVLSGPHGCGKTASVYAVAAELGFEVFEINPGSRRSGKDLLDKVGDMTKNHLVRQKTEHVDEVSAADGALEADETQAEIESGRQKTMGSFFQASTKTKARTEVKKDKKKKSDSSQPSKPNNQRQSLILLEEVDILFEEDKNFWGTVLSLLVNSRRPIIMTCTDESLLPREEMMGCRALRLSPPPPSIASDYLLMMAANEGHLLSTSSIEKLYQSQGNDLRSSITHLNFYCQMALGDRKGGLEWMLVPSKKGEGYNKDGERLRVVSDGTFTDYMDVFPTHAPNTVEKLESEIAILSDIAIDGNYDRNHGIWDFPNHQLGYTHSETMPDLGSLLSFGSCCEALSAADLMPGSHIFDASSGQLDASHRSLPGDKVSNYTIDAPVINDAYEDNQDRRSVDVVLTLKLLSSKLASASETNRSSLELFTLAEQIVNLSHSLRTAQTLTAFSIGSSLNPLSEPQPIGLMGNKAPVITSMEQPLRILATDVAPYVRGIATYDVKLEQERLKLSNLLSQGGRQGKKQRTTRSSRAALEGGRKESTRRERWFAKDYNLQSVMATAPVSWNVTLEHMIDTQKADLQEQDGADRALITEDSYTSNDGEELEAFDGHFSDNGTTV